MQDGRYAVQTPNADGRVYIPELDERLGNTINWLRWWDAAGNLLLWSAEQAEQERQRAEQEHQRAATLAAKLRELGVDPDEIH